VTPETRRLLNAPFLAAITASAASGFQNETERGLPILYSFVIPAMVLHKDTRDNLPKVVTTKMPSWAQQNAGVLAHLPSHIADLQQLVRQSLIVGYNVGLLTVANANEIVPGDGINPTTLGASAKQSLEVPEIFKRAHFLGRWLSTAGNLPTVFSVLGIGLSHAAS
jgi:hypothetical protein